MTIKHIRSPSTSASTRRRTAYALSPPQRSRRGHLLHVVDNPPATGLWSSEIYTVEIAGLQINRVRDAESTCVAAPRPTAPVSSCPATCAPGARRRASGYAREKTIDLIVLARTGTDCRICGWERRGARRPHRAMPALVVRPVARATAAVVVASRRFSDVTAAADTPMHASRPTSKARGSPTRHYIRERRRGHRSRHRGPDEGTTLMRGSTEPPNVAAQENALDAAREDWFEDVGGRWTSPIRRRSCAGLPLWGTNAARTRLRI